MSFQYHNFLNVLIKPTNACNLRCKYCFHHDSGFKAEFLSLEELSHFCNITMPHYKNLSIIWHGGEPTFIGLSRFKDYCSLVKEYANKYNIQLNQAMQSNGTLIDESFLQYLKQEQIGLGISYDGPINSLTRNSTEEFEELNNIARKNDFKFGTITVVSGLNVHLLIDTYKQMTKLNLPLQLNHYVKTSNNTPKELILDENQYINRMMELFDYWINDKSGTIQINPFARYIRDLYIGSSQLCAHSSCLRNWLCLNPNGILSPCDREFPKEYSYGNIMDYSDIRSIYNSQGYVSLIQKSIKRREKCKHDCVYYTICEGGCNNNALFEGGIENNGGFSCRITRRLFDLIDNKLRSLDAFNFPENIQNPIVVKIIRDTKAEKERMYEKY